MPIHHCVSEIHGELSHSHPIFKAKNTKETTAEQWQSVYTRAITTGCCILVGQGVSLCELCSLQTLRETLIRSL